MEDDLIAGLTRQVKEEVVENYLLQRRLIELEIEDLHKEAQETRFRALKTGRRMSRLAFLVIHPDMQKKLVKLLNIPEGSFWMGCLESKFSRGVRLIRVRALTDKTRFRKLFLEAYHRLYLWMDRYQKAYENLQAECKAVNSNIAAFQKNFDLLTILNFLRSLDTAALERKLYLGENFTPQELASVDKTLYLRPVSFEKLEVPQPVPLPKPENIDDFLNELAQEIYRKFQRKVKELIL